jgi:hypothetical protein
MLELTATDDDVSPCDDPFCNQRGAGLTRGTDVFADAYDPSIAERMGLCN